MTALEKSDTHQKALSINLDPTIFGSFAEIGAGQEVARWFLRVGGASGTVAKTISAYDKEVSDDLYGTGTRYVSKPRLQAMLNNEWQQLLGQLHASRGTHTRFFSFVDTVSARNYSGTNDCHGWVGLRFLLQPNGPMNNVIIHVNLRDPGNVDQQEAVGILGVNLLYAAHHALASPEEFLASVLEDLGRERVEIDLLELSGPAFGRWDRNEIHALLVTAGYAEAVVFPADGELIPPNELLYKRALVFAPGSYQHVDQLHANLVGDTLAQLPEKQLNESKGALGLFSLAVAGGGVVGGKLDAKETVRHVKDLKRFGYGVMVFRGEELYLMSAYTNRYTKSRVHFAIGLSVLVDVLQDRYANLAGNLLEAMARLFSQNVRVTVYPMLAEDARKHANPAGWKWKEIEGMVYAEDLQPAQPLNFLYQYLMASKLILPVRPADAVLKANVAG